MKLTNFPGPLILVLATSVVACSNALVDGSMVGLPNRIGEADLSRVTAEFRRDGGNAFVVLTGQPTSLVVEALEQAGLRPAEGADRILTFDSLRIMTTWGLIPPNGTERIAKLKFVKAIEPSADNISGY